MRLISMTILAFTVLAAQAMSQGHRSNSFDFSSANFLFALKSRERTRRSANSQLTAMAVDSEFATELRDLMQQRTVNLD